MRPGSSGPCCEDAVVLVIAHRGARDRAPENTLVAFEAAIGDGADAIEFDVLVTADGIPVLSHDEHLLRTTGVEAHVSRLTLRELRGLRVHGIGEPQPIPTLEEALAALAGRIPLFVELKAVIDPVVGFRSSRIAAEAALPLLRGMGEVIVSSFDPAGPALIRAELGLPIAHGVVHAAACTPWASTAQAAGCVQVHVEATLVDEEALEAATQLGLEVCAWTVDDVGIATRFAGLGVAGIFCDAPGRMRAALDA